MGRGGEKGLTTEPPGTVGHAKRIMCSGDRHAKRHPGRALTVGETALVAGGLGLDGNARPNASLVGRGVAAASARRPWGKTGHWNAGRCFRTCPTLCALFPSLKRRGQVGCVWHGRRGPSWEPRKCKAGMGRPRGCTRARHNAASAGPGPARAARGTTWTQEVEGRLRRDKASHFSRALAGITGILARHKTYRPLSAAGIRAAAGYLAGLSHSQLTSTSGQPLPNIVSTPMDDFMPPRPFDPSTSGAAWNTGRGGGRGGHRTRLRLPPAANMRKCPRTLMHSSEGRARGYPLARTTGRAPKTTEGTPPVAPTRCRLRAL